MSETNSYITYIVEPNPQLAIPYMYLPPKYSITSFLSVNKAIRAISHQVPDLLLLSTSYQLSLSIRILEKLKDACFDRIIPLILVIDWMHRLPHVPGTSWGNNIGLLHSLSSEQEVLATLDRIMPNGVHREV